MTPEELYKELRKTTDQFYAEDEYWAQGMPWADMVIFYALIDAFNQMGEPGVQDSAKAWLNTLKPLPAKSRTPALREKLVEVLEFGLNADEKQFIGILGQVLIPYLPGD